MESAVKSPTQSKVKLTVFIFVSIVLVYVFFLPSKKSDEQEVIPQNNKELKLPVTFEGPKVLIGKWMGATNACLDNYRTNTTQVFTLGRGYIQESGKATQQDLIQKKLDKKDVPEKIQQFIERSCADIQKVDGNSWFSLVFKRPAGNKVFYWYGKTSDLVPTASDVLPPKVEGVLFYMNENGITAFEAFDLTKIKT